MTTAKAPMSSASTNGNAASAKTRRVFVVGDEPLAKLVREILLEAGVEARVDAVGDYLMALGEAAVARPSVVIGRVAGMDDGPAAVAAALRRLAPNARLVIVAETREEPDAVRAVSVGFDDYVIDPIDPDELIEAMELDEEETPAPVEEKKEKDKIRPSPQPYPSEGRGGLLTAQTGDELGDVDLVEQVLRDPPGLRAMALQIIRARSGTADIAWSETLDKVPAGAASVPVEFQGSGYGYLHGPASPPERKNELAAWAEWLSRWLALGKHVCAATDASHRDELTGVWNRRYFNRFLADIMARAARERFRVTLLVFDIDDFKRYNDSYGHGAGDEVLRETARMMQSVVRTHDVVARIGGDEFAVIFWDAEAPRQPNSQHPQSAVDAAKRFQKAVCEKGFPKLLKEVPGTLTISGGLASYPWDGRTPQELLELADNRALQSKRQGKNAITFGPGAEQGMKAE